MSFIGYTPFMLYIDRPKLESLLGERGLSINKLAETCGISRQSIYKMFYASSVFNSSFEKIINYLNVDPSHLTYNRSLPQELLKRAPERIKQSVLQLTTFCKRHNSDLFLHGEFDAGKHGFKHEWNFAIYFPTKDNDPKLRILRQNIIEDSFPYIINITNLNRAPRWFIINVIYQHVRLYGETDIKNILSMEQ